VVKKTVEIRVRATVEEGSVEEKLLAFLDDEAAIPFKKSEMWMKAAKMCWLSLALKYKQCSPDEIEESLYDCDYSWEMHWEYLLTKARLRLARIRHRVYPVNPSIRETDTEMSQTNWHQGNLDKNPISNSREPRSRGIPEQASNVNASEVCTNTLTTSDKELEDGAVVKGTDAPLPFNLFGNSIISKQS
jgi:hypothetical protein